MVKINRHIVSEHQSVRMGVPQGSILGPFLFIIYSNDLIYELKDCKVSITLYADDTILYTGHEDIYKACAENLLAMTVLYDWCNKNRLSINLNKTKHMVIGKDCNNDLAIPSIKLNGMKIENVHNYNYLGVIIDDKLSFDDMVDAKYNKINVRIHQLGKLRKYINSEIAQVIYKQMILPLFDYADFMVESARKPKIDKLEKLQEKGIRYVDNDIHYTADIETLYRTYNIQKLFMRYKEHLSCIMYRYSKLSDKLEYKRPSINLRSNKKVKFKKLRKRKYEQYLKSPLVRGVKVWEMLPVAVQKATTKVKFKSYMKQICRP